MSTLTLDWKAYLQKAEEAATEGIVLLKNDNHVLPLVANEKIAIFGRMQAHYYKSGTGSGGMVNVYKVVSIVEALRERTTFIIDTEVEKKYQEWEENHAYEYGDGWGSEPWSQEELLLDATFVKEASKRNETALVIIGRTAGEDQDNQDVPGAYRLQENEEDMLQKVRANFSKVVVILNVGNVIDMSFVERFTPDAVLYVWQGGMVGGYGVASILSGKVSPSGKLSDTIAKEISQWPCDADFGDAVRNFYTEDIYVGYRYFETFAKEQVRYPFGYGLSYTTFTCSLVVSKVSYKTKTIELQVEVRNAGNCSGKEVVQIYVSAPSGELGKPIKTLVEFKKTKELHPNEIETIIIQIPFMNFASFDDAGSTGYKSCFVLEKGTYIITVGNNVREVSGEASFKIEELLVLEKVSEALYPSLPFERMQAFQSGEEYAKLFSKVPVYEQSQKEHVLQAVLPEVEKIEQRYTLIDVKNKYISMHTFIESLTDEEMICLVCGEGMGSLKVTSGTAAAFGGVSPSLQEKKVPCGCCDDGPSGLRLDTGEHAISLPNGTLLACSFNVELVEELYAFTGIEMIKNKVDILLGPGVNIHRHPLNGRNFEYYSEDPLLSGKMGSAQLKGLHRYGVTGTPKHFCGNNQETFRHKSDSVISARALREIYLKPFEITVKEAGATTIMTTYGSVNGRWTASSYDLNTMILREDWKFNGFVMTDWWASFNEDVGQESNRTSFSEMVKAQNDVYMVVPDGANNNNAGDILSALKEGKLLRKELARSAKNICSFLLNTHAFKRMIGEETIVLDLHHEDFQGEVEGEFIGEFTMDDFLRIPLEQIDSSKGKTYLFTIIHNKMGMNRMELTASSDASYLAQMSVTLFQSNFPMGVFSFNGTEGKEYTIGFDGKRVAQKSRYKLFFRETGLVVKQLTFTRIIDESEI